MPSPFGAANFPFLLAPQNWDKDADPVKGIATNTVISTSLSAIKETGARWYPTALPLPFIRPR